MPYSQINTIFEELNNSGIIYCHFKSNANLDISFAGNTDFDLLVNKQSITEFKSLLYKLGFKQRYTTFDKNYVCMEDYLYYDDELEKIHHFHIHYDLFFGKKLKKNIFLNIDFQQFIIKDQNFPIAIIQPEIELVLLVLRTIFKFDLFVRRNILIHRKFTLSESVIREFDCLLNTINKDTMDDILNEYFSNCQFFINDFLKAYLSKNITMFFLLKCQYLISKNCEKELFFANSKKYKNLYSIKKNIRKFSTNWIESGGKTIAFIGVDGSGKSSTVEVMHQFLSYKMSVEKLYLGKVSNNITILLNLISAVFSKLEIKKISKIFRGLMHIYIANKKRNIFNKGQNNKCIGIISLYDRYPVKEFYTMNDPMDCPKLNNMDIKYFRKKELELFDAIDNYPDLIIILDIDIETSLKRKKEHIHIKKRLKEKIRAVQTLKSNNVHQNLHIVDAKQNQKLVLAEIKKIVWNYL